MPAKASIRLKTMCGVKSPAIGRMFERLSLMPSTRTSWPISRRVSMTSCSIFHSASRMSMPAVSSGGTRWSWTSARMRSFFTGSIASQEQAVAAAMEIVHGLHGEESGELLACLLLGNGEPQLQLAAPLDHVFEDLVDRVLVDAGPARDDAPDRATDSVDELLGGDVVGELRCVGEQPSQIAIVEVRVVHAVVLPLTAIVLPQGGAEARERIDFLGILDRWCRPTERVHQTVHVLQLAQRAPTGVTLAPLAVRCQPHGERFGEVFVGMALGIPGVEVEHEALAIGLGCIELRIRLAGRAERVLPL